MAEPINVLIVEDDENLRLTLRDILEDEYVVSTAGTVANARDQINQYNFQLIVLDLMLPDGDGYQFCRELRGNNYHMPILMLTARSLEDDLVKGFDVGADDYLIKPYRANELLARIKALLKRGSVTPATSPNGNRFNLNGFSINRDARSVRTSTGDSVELTPKELDVLLYLWDNPHKAISRIKLLEQVWGNTVIDTRTVDNFISSIKKKLNLSQGNSVYVETVRGVGYRLEKKS